MENRMIDITDPRSQHILTHPHFLTGIQHERERIITIIEMAMCHCDIDCDALYDVTASELIDEINGVTQ